MPRLGTTEQLGRLIANLRSQRQDHVRAITDIDSNFAQFGLKPGGAPRRGRPPGGGRHRRKRGTFKETAEQFILGYVKAHPDATTARINKAWKGAGRGGSADTTLSNLTKAKQLKRTKAKEGKGSTYRVA